MRRFGSRKLTPYGRWLKIQLMDRCMSASELAASIGTKKQRLNEVMYGVIPGHKYRPLIEKTLGAKPPADIAS